MGCNGCGKSNNTPVVRKEVAPTRPTCLECVEKHIGAVLVLVSELRDGYKTKILAIGHLHEAAEECQDYVDLHLEIRKVRKEFQKSLELPNIDDVIYMLANIRAEHDLQSPSLPAVQGS